IFHLANDDGSPMFLIVAPDSSRIGLAPVDGDDLRDTMAADGLGQEAQGYWFVPLLRQQQIDRLTVLIHRAIEIPPVACDFDIRLVHPPAAPHGPFVAMERLFE